MSPEPRSAPNILEPVRAGERLGLLDALRGLALLGILVANMVSFGGPTPPMSWLDRLATGLELFLVEDKFYALFSLLFGIGFALQLDRASRRGTDAAGTYRRRLWWLLAIGLAHSVLVWDGDILTLYALVGFALLAVHSWPAARLWPLVALGPLVTLGMHLLWALSGMVGRKGFVEGDGSGSILARGGYLDVLSVRLRPDDLAYTTLGELMAFGPIVLALFLVGRWAGRHGIAADPAAHRPLLLRTLIVAGAVGLALNALALPLVPDPSRLGRFGAAAALLLGGLAFCLAYSSGLALVWTRPAWRARLGPLTAVGRMALTNYLAQSLVSTTVFYEYGLGLYGHVGAAARVALALAIFAVQVVASRWWLAHHEFGPAEWAWRRLTYGREAV